MKKAFTFVELIVIIVIIGVIASVGIIGMTSVKAKAKNTAKLANIEQIRGALQMYKADNGFYPPEEDFDLKHPLVGANGKTYLAVIPSNLIDTDCPNPFTYETYDNNFEYNLNYCVSAKMDKLAVGNYIANGSELSCVNTCGTKVCGSNGCGGTCGSCGIYDLCNASGTCETRPFVTCGDPVSYGGEVYPTVNINGKCWFAKNLNIGTMIPFDTYPVNGPQGNNATIEKYCYNNISGQGGCETYGGLYEWYEAMRFSSTEGIQGICPSGWHIPTDAEFSSMSTYLGGSSVSGTKLKANSALWNTNTGTNESGFTALPAGRGGNLGGNLYLGQYGFFWVSTVSPVYSTSSLSYRLHYDDPTVYKDNVSPISGYSVRCILGSGCNASCEGKVCGDDGCGGSCGTCPGYDNCNASGQCEPCVANCLGKTCGSDGCGGTCGAGCSYPASNNCSVDTCKCDNSDSCADGLLCVTGSGCVGWTQATSSQATNIRAERATIGYKRGSGDGAVTIVGKGDTQNLAPVGPPTPSNSLPVCSDEYEFVATTTPAMPGGGYCVYAGTGTVFALNGLTKLTIYNIKTYEYKLIGGVYYYMLTESDIAPFKNVTDFRTPLR